MECKSESIVVLTVLCRRYNGTYSSHGTHISFVSSSGSLVDSLPCGLNGARLVCTTCGRDDKWLESQGATPSLSRTDVPVIGWLKTALWVPTEPGLASVAVGVAHNGLGTPAVTITRVLVNVIANVSDVEHNQKEQAGGSLEAAAEAEARLWKSSFTLAADRMIYGQDD